MFYARNEHMFGLRRVDAYCESSLSIVVIFYVQSTVTSGAGGAGGGGGGRRCPADVSDFTTSNVCDSALLIIAVRIPTESA